MVAEMIAPFDLVPVIKDKIVHIKKIGEDYSEARTQIEQTSQTISTEHSSVPLIETGRKNIKDPGQVAQEQRPEIMNRIQGLTKTQREEAQVETVATEKSEEQGTIMQKIEPSAPADEQPAAAE